MLNHNCPVVWKKTAWKDKDARKKEKEKVKVEESLAVDECFCNHQKVSIVLEYK